VPLTNFPVLPVVTKLPYDYGVPDPLSPEKLEEQYEEKVGAPS
jgi:hypothetical protein